ncbi:hypothetical protein D1872_262530 [compost metagenome]
MQHTKNAANAPVGNKPDATKDAPITKREPAMVSVRLLNPPHFPSNNPPASIPIAKMTSAAEASFIVPPKYPIVMRGNNALMGINAKINSPPSQRRATKPL